MPNLSSIGTSDCNIDSPSATAPGHEASVRPIRQTPGPADYTAFLRRKIKMASFKGFDVKPEALHPTLFPHQRDIVRWAVLGGNRAIFASFGLGKSLMQSEWLRQIALQVPGDEPLLIVCPLGVRLELIRDAAMLGIELRFIRSADEMTAGHRFYITNYESVRDGKLDPTLFLAVSLDEASVLRSFGSKTYQEFLPLFEGVRFKLVNTATPSPNRFKELIHYAGFLGVMDTGQALTRFFQRDSEKAGHLTLYPHKEQEFWLWVSSWAVFIQKPSDLGYSDEGYDLPPLEVVYHEVPSDYSKAGHDSWGQGLLFTDPALGLGAAAAEKRDSLPARVEKVREILAASPGEHFVVWHDLEAERHALQAAVPEAVSVWGSQDLDERERRIVGFGNGEFRVLSTKPVIAGSGCNFQRHCHREVFAGIGFKFNDLIQAVHRCHRFQQKHQVRIDIVYSEAEREVLRTLQAKWTQHEELVSAMTDIIKKYGLNQLAMQETLARSIGVERIEVKGDLFTVANNDCVDEARRQPENHVDLIVTSIPFANHYEYCPSYNDFGHTDDNGHFWEQMDFLTPELLRILKPGRLYCCHVKDRILFGNVTGAGAPTVSPFHCEAIMHGRKHGFDYMGLITVVTDVVRENNQTYRLTYQEQRKDGTKMGVGSPEYIILFRKPQTDRSKGFADERVVKTKGEYSLARWQVDAHAFWRSSGNRQITAEELAALGPDKLASLFTRYSLEQVYDYEFHVRIGEELQARGALPSTFMSLAPGSHHPDVWHDVTRMLTLNSEQSRRAVEKHVCPLQFDIVDRLIERYSNPGELVYDPFCGLGTVPYRAILKGRRGGGSELNAGYFMDQVHYLRSAEQEVSMPSLFDALEAEQAAA
jgi:SAM-dependent methyltransferase